MVAKRKSNMNLSKSVSKSRPITGSSDFKVGDQIQFTYMSKPVRGQIIEDRGRIGIGGRHLYRVVGKAGSITRVLELTAERLEKVECSKDEPLNTPTGPM